jgi:hypothetical protein
LVCICVYSVFVLSCVWVEALRRGDHSSKESYRLRIDQKSEKRPGSTRAVEPVKNVVSKLCILPEYKIYFMFVISSVFLWPTQPPIQCIPGDFPPGIKRPGREADHSPSSSAQIKNGGAIPPLTHLSS